MKLEGGVAENWDPHFYHLAGDVLAKVKIAKKKITSPEDARILDLWEKELAGQFKSSGQSKDTAEEGGIDTYRLAIIKEELKTLLEKYNTNGKH